MILSLRARLGERGAALAVALATLAATGTSLGNGFAYDDAFVVERNPLVRGLHGVWAIFRAHYWFDNPESPLYRPLTVVLWAGQWAVGQGRPWVFHAVNVLFAVLTSLLVLALARRLLAPSAALAAALLFAVHPVHAEVTGNVVGQSELLVAMGALGVVVAWIDLRRRTGGVSRLRLGATAAAAFLIAVFAKEHGLVVPALLVLAECTVLRAAPPLARDRDARLLLLVLALLAAGYLAARNAVVGRAIGEEVHAVFMVVDARARMWTMVAVVPEWLRLLFVPLRHAPIPGPPETPVLYGPSILAVPGLLALSGIVALAAATWRAYPVVAFGVVWCALLLLPVSNVLYRTGIVFSERSLFLPSAGALIAAVALVQLAWQRIGAVLGAAGHRHARRALLTSGALLVVVGAYASARRQLVWKNNEALFAAAVRDTPRSYRAHEAYAGHLEATGRVASGRRHYLRALELLPLSDPYMLASAADILMRMGEYAQAEVLYREVLQVAPDWHAARLRLASCLLSRRRFRAAEMQTVEGLRRGGPYRELRTMLLVARQLAQAEEAR